MKRKNLFYLCFILLIPSCYPGGIEYYEDTDIVYTTFDDQFDFVSTTTYSIPDRIVKITGNIADEEEPEFVEEPYNSQMLDKIKENMMAYGWTKVDDPADADLVLFPAVWTNTTIYYWYNYWCWYYPYYCGWGWGFPYVTAYTTGTLVMNLVVDGEDYIDPATTWTAAANGLLSGSFNLNRVNNAIDQAFEQSPYLNTK